MNTTGHPDADHLLALHEKVRTALFTGTHDLDAVREALDEADDYVRQHFGGNDDKTSKKPPPHK